MATSRQALSRFSTLSFCLSLGFVQSHAFGGSHRRCFFISGCSFRMVATEADLLDFRAILLWIVWILFAVMTIFMRKRQLLTFVRSPNSFF
jgi:hypothetical protein